MRNRTVQSVLARRSMNNGGMVAPPTQASGILRSSPSLIDAVSNDALSDMGGGTLSMAQGGAAVNMQPSYVFNQGGIARFAGGGAPRGTFSEDTDVSIQLPSLAYGAKPSDGVTIEQLMNMTPTQKLERYAPRAAELSEDNIIGPQPFRNSMIPQIDGESLFGGNSTPAEDLIVKGPGSILGFIDQAARGLSQVNAEAGQAMVDVGQFLFSGKNKKTGYVNKFQQIQEVNTLLRRLPDQSQEIEALTKQIVDENPNITGENLSKQVIDKLSFEVDQEDLTKIGNKLGVEEGMGAVGDGMGPIDAGVADGDVSLEEAPQTIEEKIKKVQESDDADEGMGAAGDGGVSQAQEAQDMMSGMGAVGDGKTPDYSEEETGGDPASVVAKTFNEKQGDPETTKRKTKQDYINDFKDSLPEYEGMSEEEKGFTIMEAGFRVMGGKSPNAIQNIAEGLKGISAEFVKDKKTKRAYDQQINLSAAKYGLENIAKDKASDAALAKEKRSLFNKLFVVSGGENFTWNGQEYGEGDRIIATTGSLQDGTFPINKVISETASLKAIDLQKANIKANAKLLKDAQISPDKFVKSMDNYVNSATQVKANIAIQQLLKEVVIPLQAGKVTGGMAAIKDIAFKLENLTGIKVPGSDGSLAEYKLSLGKAITSNITALLQEGNRTVSDADRKRAEIIGGLFSDSFGSAATKNRGLLAKQLASFNQMIERNSQTNASKMFGLEQTWATTQPKGSAPGSATFSDILKRSRGNVLDTRNRNMVKASNRIVKWSDIQDSSGNYVRGWNKRKQNP